MVGSVNTLWGLVHVRLYMYIYMNRESMKSNWPPSLHSYSAPPEAWASLRQCSMDVLLTKLPPRENNHTLTLHDLDSMHVKFLIKLIRTSVTSLRGSRHSNYYRLPDSTTCTGSL